MMNLNKEESEIKIYKIILHLIKTYILNVQVITLWFIYCQDLLSTLKIQHMF
jgi:hypothetical protein